MTTETMTIHKALSELKILDGRILDATDVKFVTANKHSNKVIGGVSINDYKNNLIGNFDKVVDLIGRRNAIKRAVVLSNAQTIVTINDKEYTVAEAIEMKNHGLEAEKLLLDTLRKQYSLAVKSADVNNGKDLEKRAEDYVIGVSGSKENIKNMEYENLMKTFIEMNTYEIVDPINVSLKIEELENKISSFTSEVDSTLSCSNALTKITIEY